MRQAADMSAWRGRVDAEEGPLGLRWHRVVRSLDAPDASGEGGVALIGFACDAGVARNHGRVGAREGPAAIRAMLGNLPVRRCAALVDAGDIVSPPPAVTGSHDAQDDRLELVQAELAVAIAELLGRGLFPVALGGGHEIAYGSFGGLARHLAQTSADSTAPRVGVVNLDAHFDLRLAERASSGTPFRQIAEDCAARGWPFSYCCLGVSDFANTAALFERARRLGAVWRRDEEMDLAQRDATLATLSRFLAGVDHVYLTICLDVLPAAVAPGVSAPAARGVALEVIEPIVDCVTTSDKLRLADVAELNPRFDIDSHTARVAARLVARVAEGVAGRFSEPARSA